MKLKTIHLFFSIFLITLTSIAQGRKTDKEYYNNGNLKSVAVYDYVFKERRGDYNYYKPIPDGKFTAYYENGNIFIKGQFAKNMEKKIEWSSGRRIGEWKIYTLDGKLATIKKYNNRNSNLISTNYVGLIPVKERSKNGYWIGEKVIDIEESRYTQFNTVNHLFDDGKPEFKTFFYGEWKYYNSENLLTHKRIFKEKKTDWAYSETEGYYYHKNGEISHEGKIERNKRQGIWILYFPNGQKKYIYKYINSDIWRILESYEPNGKQTLNNGNGIYSVFNDNGEKELEIEFLDGQRNGKAIWYYKNGQIKQTAVYKKDEKLNNTGLRWEILNSYDKNGNEREKGTLKDGNGTWISYDSNGSISNVSRYKGGKEIDLKKLNQLLVQGKSVDEIINIINSKNYFHKYSEFDISEKAINSFGYEILREDKKREALKIFKLNTALYPNGYNTWDSLGECLLLLGEKENGIKAYKKSLKLNPKNKNAKKIIEQNN